MYHSVKSHKKQGRELTRPIDAFSESVRTTQSYPESFRVTQSHQESCRTVQNCPELLRDTAEQSGNGPTDIPAYRDARTHLKMKNLIVDNVNINLPEELYIELGSLKSPILKQKESRLHEVNL